MTKKQIDRHINEIFCRRCSGVQINIMDSSRVFAAGRQAIADGQDPEAAIVAFVQTIRQN